eukprot:8660507-Pyramimonas_sp.AAC.1
MMLLESLLRQLLLWKVRHPARLKCSAKPDLSVATMALKSDSGNLTASIKRSNIVISFQLSNREEVRTLKISLLGDSSDKSKSDYQSGYNRTKNKCDAIARLG